MKIITIKQILKFMITSVELTYRKISIGSYIIIRLLVDHEISARRLQWMILMAVDTNTACCIHLHPKDICARWAEYENMAGICLPGIMLETD